MHFYYVNPDLNYLSCISEWLVRNHWANLDKIKIFLPNGLLCQFLSKLLIKELSRKTRGGHFLLPKLVPLSDIASDVLAIKSANIVYNAAEKIEQNLALAKIISNKQNLKIVDAIDLARQLNRNFEELIAHGVDLNNISVEYFFDKSIHLQQQIEYLEFYYQKLRQVLKEQNKLTSYDFSEEVFKTYSITGTSMFIGTARQSKTFYKFLANNLNNDNCVFILPPVSLGHLSSFTDAFELLNVLNIKQEQIKPLMENNAASFCSIDNFIEGDNPTKAQVNFDHISVIEADNEIEESNLILLLIKDFIDQNPQGLIALISPNYTVARLVVNNLKKYGIEFTNLIGQSLINTNLAQFIICIADYLLDHNNIEKLLLCLKHPYVSCEYSWLLEKFLRENRFINNIDQVVKYIETHESKSFQRWWQSFFALISSKQAILAKEEQDLQSLIEINLKVAQQIYPKIWHLNHSSNAILFFHNLIKSSSYIGPVKKQDCVAIIKNLLKKSNIIEADNNKQVVLLSPENALYLNFDLVILADMNENSWPNLQSSDMWLTNQLRHHLSLLSLDDVLKTKIQDFYLSLCNKQVIITRSKKVNNSLAAPSKLLLKLFSIADKHKLANLHSKNHYLHFLRHHLNLANIACEEQDLLISADSFPKSVSATNIELLVRNPYGFFAKNILKLYPIQELNLDSLNAEFGTLIHKIIAIYNQSGSTLSRFLEIAEHELEAEEINEFFWNLWWPKICKIGKEYVLYDQQRRKLIKEIYSEVYGEMYVECDAKLQKIIAIADEIVITKNNTAYILDYKTGVVPSKKEVLSGLSPQLIVEGLILQQGGFKNIAQYIPEHITFVKLASSEPYVSEVTLNDIDFNEQYLGLKNLLLHYTCKDVCYPVTPNKTYAPKYDNYKYLARKVN